MPNKTRPLEQRMNRKYGDGGFDRLRTILESSKPYDDKMEEVRNTFNVNRATAVRWRSQYKHKDEV